MAGLEYRTQPRTIAVQDDWSCRTLTNGAHPPSLSAICTAGRAGLHFQSRLFRTAVASRDIKNLQGPEPWVRSDIWGHPHIPLATGQTTSTLVHLTIMTLAGSTSDRAKALRAEVEHPSMARRNCAEVVVADEIAVYHCVQRVVRRAFLCGVDRLSGNSHDHRRTWIRGRLTPQS